MEQKGVNMSEESTKYYFDLHQYFETIFVAANNKVVVDSRGRIGCNWNAKFSVNIKIGDKNKSTESQ
jgi:hypothetical protein